MDFLKEILGDDLYSQLESKINEHNGNEANKDKQIKLGNLGGGDYIGKGKHESEMERLNALLSGKDTELTTANQLIADLKKGTKGNEELQGKISGYETQVAELQKQLQETKLKSAVKVALLSEKAVDIDYLTFKVNEKLKDEGKTLELDENDNIKGWDEVISGLKTQFPTQFTSVQDTRTVQVNKRPDRTKADPGITKEQFDKMGYQNRLKLKQEQPEVYAMMTGKATE